MKLLKFIFLVLIIPLFSIADKDSDKKEALLSDNLTEYNANDLRPTQAVFGLKAAQEKVKFIEKMDKDERQEYLRENPIPVVLGPQNNFYMIDHHHLCWAVLESGHSKVYLKVVEDYSNLDAETFWEKMKEKKYVYLLDENGNEIKYTDLPNSLKDLKNDPYRSLAYFSRENGGYNKNNTPFSEFKWANYYRAKLPIKMLENTWNQSIKKAIDVSKNSGANHLPGYIQSKNSCQKVF